MAIHANHRQNQWTLWLMGATIIIAIFLILAGCDRKITFYSADEECLIVKQDSTFNCYKTHEAYAIHEGYSLDHAKQKFNSHMLEAEKIENIKSAISQENTYNYPVEKNKADYIEKRVIESRQAHNKTQEDE